MLEKIVKFIEEQEGCKLNVYKDSGGVDTIGIGTLWKSDIPKKITRQQALDYCTTDCINFIKKIEKVCTASLNENQKMAIISLVYNIGFSSFSKSTLLKKLNKGDYAGAADEFLRWNKDNGKVIQGLTNRRQRERAKFLESV